MDKPKLLTFAATQDTPHWITLSVLIQYIQPTNALIKIQFIKIFKPLTCLGTRVPS